MRTLTHTYFLYYIVALVLLSTPLISLSHGLGASYEEVIDGYLVDIGYEPEIPTVDSRVRFDFTIFDAQTEEEVEYTDLWVRINLGTQVVFAGGIHAPEFGTAGLLYTFPEVGEYAISVRFQDKGEQLTEVAFPVTVIPGEKKSPFNSTSVITGIVGFFLGGLAVFISTRRKKIS